MMYGGHLSICSHILKTSQVVRFPDDEPEFNLNLNIRPYIELEVKLEIA
jgi:hypothetical protein